MSKVIPVVAVVALLLAAHPNAYGITVGAGTSIPLEELDTAGVQPRTNLDESFFAALPVGTYRVNNFSFAAGQSGSVTPFVAVNTGADAYQVLALGDQVDVAGAGTQTVPFAGGTRYFSVTTANTPIYGGITNPPGSQNPVFLDNNTPTFTEHDNSPGALTGPGSPVNGFSHPTLPRTYAFGVDFVADSPDRVGAGVGIHHQVVDNANGPRTNVDQTFTRVLQPGIYVVSDWEYAAGQAGQVTPFVAMSNGADSYQTLAVGAEVSVAAVGNATTNFGKSNTFVITAPTTIYGGITNPAGSNNPIFLDDGTTAQTDHDGSALSPVTGPGQTVNGFSNPNLGRTYAFAINYAERDAAQRVGPDFTIPHEALDTAGGGPRMNVDDTFTLNLGPGTYDITDFSFSTGRAGLVTPFLATFDGTNYEVIAIGDTQSVGAGNSDVTVPFGGDGFFTLLNSATIYGGITNPSGDNPVFTDLNNGFTVDHDGTPAALTGVGQLLPISGFSNPNLGRSYAFSIGINQAIPEPATLSLLALAGLGLLGRRRRA